MILKSTRQRLWFLAISITAFLVIKTYLDDSSASESNDVVVVQNTSSKKRLSNTSERLPELISLARIKKSRASNDNEDLFRKKSWYIAPPPPPPAPPPAPVAPPMPFTFIGKATHADGTQTLFISDKSHVFLVHGGETLNKIYRIDGIEGDKLAMTYLPLNKKQYLNLVEVH